jgi:hypothetical protein
MFSHGDIRERSLTRLARFVTATNDPRVALILVFDASDCSPQEDAAASGMVVPMRSPISARPVVARSVLAAAALTVVLATPVAAAVTRPVGYGARGAVVVRAQRRLAALGYLEHGSVDGVFGEETWHAVVAFQGWEQLSRDGVIGPKTLHALRHAHRPRPWVRLRDALEVDLNRQVLLVVKDDAVKEVIHASTAAPPYATPRGRFVVIRRERKSWSRPYHVWLPDALYFYRGWAIHGFAVVPDRAASHGCIRIPLGLARRLFRQAPLGTPVIIRGLPSPPPIAPWPRMPVPR